MHNRHYYNAVSTYIVPTLRRGNASAGAPAACTAFLRYQFQSNPAAHNNLWCWNYIVLTLERGNNPIRKCYYKADKGKPAHSQSWLVLVSLSELNEYAELNLQNIYCTDCDAGCYGLRVENIRNVACFFAGAAGKDAYFFARHVREEDDEQDA